MSVEHFTEVNGQFIGQTSFPQTPEYEFTKQLSGVHTPAKGNRLIGKHRYTGKTVRLSAHESFLVTKAIKEKLKNNSETSETKEKC